MVVRTKAYKMSSGCYIKLGIQTILQLQWWIFPLLLSFMAITFFIKTIWFIVVGVVFFICYLLFWLVQFYGLTQVEENRLMFERVCYEINHQYFIMQLNPKQGMPIPWTEIIKVYKKSSYFLLVRSKILFFFLPFKIFHGQNEIKFFTTLLQRKGLLK